MKAIQIRYLGSTNTKGVRIKAWSEAGSVTVSRDYAIDYAEQALQVATAYLYKMEWNENSKINGFGRLPNGDYVATLGSK